MRKRIEKVLHKFMHGYQFTLVTAERDHRYWLYLENSACRGVGDWGFSLADELRVWASPVPDVPQCYELIYNPY